MRSLLSRLVVLAVGVVLGIGLYALGIGGVLVVPFAVLGVLVSGELYLFATGDGG